MELPVAGLGLGVISQVRTITQSISARVENYNEGPETFESLSENLALLKHNIDEVDKVLQKFPEESLAEISLLFKKTLDHIRKSLLTANESVEKEFSKTFTGSNKNLVRQLRRVFRATSLSKKLKAVDSRIKESSGQLQHISTVLAGALGSLELHNALIPGFGNLASAKEEYRPASSAPALSHTVRLNFGATDADGRFETPEGTLKHKVLSCASSATVTAAAGVMDVTRTLVPAYGVVGMAGVGKTIALQGLASDEEICDRFPDGIQYMSFGRGATIEDAIEEIVKIMKITGASSSIAPVRSSKSLKEAVDHAVVWFQGKVCLFLVDDLWPNDFCAIGYLNDLRQLLRCSQDSRMAITTRSVNIAIGAGSVVDFGARDPHGFVSISIFMTYAGQELQQDLFISISKILSWCGGLPIALSVSGSAVGHLVRTRGSFERACELYVADFEERRASLAEEEDPQGTTLSDCIRLSLKYLDVDFSKWKERQAEEIEHTVSDLYTSLCVLTNQVWIPVEVLSRMWKLSEKSALDVVKLFCGLSLATLSYRRVGDGILEKAGLTLHDLHLEFCKLQAGSKRSNRSDTLWHSTLLNGYLDAPLDFLSLNPCTQSSQQIVNTTPRSWWSIPEDGYTHANLARHLVISDGGAELAALLLDARWANVRGNHGGIPGLKADFEVLDKLLESGDSGDRENNPSKGIRKSFKLLSKAMQLSWGSFSDGKRTFQFQMCGRLLSLRNDDVIIDAAVKSFEAHTPKPYLMPVSRFFPELNSAQIWEIPTRGFCGCVTRSPCGRYIAAGAATGILIADPITGDVVKRLKDHREVVKCIKFASASKKIVSASQDGTVAVWEWEKPDSPMLLLEGHSSDVMSVDVSSDCTCIVSGSRDCTVRRWNGFTGMQTGEFAQGSVVRCVALCSEDKKVAIGLDNGTVKVLDICTGDTVFEDLEAHTDFVTSVAFSSEGGRMATCSFDGTIRVWDAKTWTTVRSPVEGHTHYVTSVSFSPDGDQLVSGSLDNTIRLWDVAAAESVGASSNRPVLSERNVFYCDTVTSVTFTCNGKRIVSGTYSGIVRVWDAAFVAEEKQQSFGHSEMVLGVSISPDGLRVATGSGDKTVRLWDTKTGAQIGIALEGHAEEVHCVSFGPDGQYLVSGSGDRTLRMWDTEHFTEIGSPFEGHSDRVRCVSFNSDGLRIVSGSEDKTLRLWNVQNRKQIGDPLTGHSGSVRYISESSDGRFVVSRDWFVKKEERETIIWNRSCNAVWRSKESVANNRITNKEAESIIRSCGHDTPHLWPICFPNYAAEIFKEDDTMYSSVHGDKIPLGNFPSIAWEYDSVAKVLAAGLRSGGVAICRLLV